MALPARAHPVGETFFETGMTLHDFSVDSCTVGSLQVCTAASDTKMECIMNRIASGGQGAIATIIKNRTNDGMTDICGGFDYCAFGAVKTGASTETTFYCQWDGDEFATITLVGTDERDRLYFHHTQNGEFDLEGHSGVSLVDGEILGQGGNDDVHGSRTTASGYKDWLYGNDGDDIVWGHDGHDRIYSGAGDDRIWAGPGNDHVSLEGGNNHASGEDGEDTVVGGPGRDFIHGGRQDDLLYGHGGDDAICGGDDADLLDGGPQADKLYGGAGGDTEDGGPGTDNCQDHSWPAVNCEGVQATEPPECPSEYEGSPH